MRLSRGRRSASLSPITTVVAVMAVLSAVLMAACSGAGAGAPSGGPIVSDAWVRPPMGTGRPAAGYLTIVGGGSADALVGATSPSAESIGIHETMPDMSGMMAMHHVDRIEVPAGSTVSLEPGGYHLMLFGLDEALVPGSTVEITLVFDDAPDVVVQAEVRAG